MKEVKRAYNMSNADLCQLASDFVVFMTRDATEFAARGVTAGNITAFEALGNAFEVFPSDDEYVGLLEIEVAAKNNLRLLCIAHIQTISGYFDQKWGLKSGQYKRLGISKIQSITDKNFLFRCREVVRIAEEYLADLTSIGLTQIMIDALDSNAQLFEDKLNAIADKRALRDEKTEERSIKGNELYDYITLYSKIGKLIWENSSEARYNDYVIYTRKPGVPGKIDNLSYDVPSRTADWDLEPLATSYQLQYKQNVVDGVWLPAYDGVATSTVHDPGLGNWIYRCRGVNSNGAGYWSNELEVVILVE